MPAPPPEDKNKRPRPFDPLYEQYADFCRKLRFLLAGAFSMENESLALEIISDFLERKEEDLRKLEAAARVRINSRPGDSDSVERLVGSLIMEREDYKILFRIAEIKRNGGPRWETLQALIQDQALEDRHAE